MSTVTSSSSLNGYSPPTESMVLQYSGKATTMQIDTLLELLEKMIINDGLPNSLRRRLYCIAMESLQNLSSHVPDQVLDTVSDTTINPMYIRFYFEGYDGKFRIETSNYILRHNVDNLTKKLDYINTLDDIAKKEYYNYLIKNLPFSDKGGAGLGLVDIARKSKQPIRYKVVDTNAYYVLLTLTFTLDAETVSQPLVA